MCKTWVRWYHGTSTLAGKGDDRLLLVELAVFTVMRTAKENQTHIGPESRVKRLLLLVFVFLFSHPAAATFPQRARHFFMCAPENSSVLLICSDSVELTRSFSFGEKAPPNITLCHFSPVDLFLGLARCRGRFAFSDFSMQALHLYC